MSRSKKPRSWQKLMRQREQERNSFGGGRPAFSAIVRIEYDDIDLDEDEHEYEYLWAESIRHFVA
jgi:hypothetical protein